MHRIPNTTVRLGRALELVTAQGDSVTQWDEVDGWQMLTTPDAEDLQPGRARLYLVPGELQAQQQVNPETHGGDTYRAWHDRDAELIGELDAPDAFGADLGRALRVDYASDKWRNPGEEVEYTHDFTEGKPPRVYADFDGRGQPRGFVLVGGDMAITPEGIA